MDKLARKQRPLYTGVLKYFPDALMEVAYTSWIGNEQHNPGQPVHWAKEKSTDEADALLRHLLEAGKVDSDGVRHSAKVAWRALALLQREIEKEREDESKANLASSVVGVDSGVFRDTNQSNTPDPIGYPVRGCRPLYCGCTTCNPF